MEQIKREKSALVTGSSDGLGKEIALRFARGGYNLIIHGRKKNKLDKVYKEIKAIGRECDVVRGDLCEMSTLKELDEQAMASQIDILVNNAGIYEESYFSDITLDEIKTIINTNLIAPIYLTYMVYKRAMRRREVDGGDGGIIVNINSLAGKYPKDKESVYCASKFGLRGFSSSFQFEAIYKNVKVLDVYIGAMTHLDRIGSEKFIEAVEAADTIFDLCKDWRSLRVKEVEILRSKR